ncbi:MAG: AbrB/MazE/SpoVT family DNA-binding domain-containing protein [Candidatus ainarchaeum sp.]|nr:AbrB/MazE/SpoVT family DNA-binding domain-containing protein [Candidatus ainarchaeum sp.]
MLIGMKSITITEKGQIALPKELRENKNFSSGKKLVVLSFKDRIELIPLDKFSESLENSLLSEKSLAKEWLTKKEDIAWKDL